MVGSSPTRGLRKSDCLGCAVLLCLVVCLTLLASLFFPSSSLIKMLFSESLNEVYAPSPPLSSPLLSLPSPPLSSPPLPSPPLPSPLLSSPLLSSPLLSSPLLSSPLLSSPRADRRSSEPVASGTRSRSSHVISNSPKNPRKRISSAAPPAVTSSPHHTSPRTSPRTSPTLTSPSRDVRGRSRSPGRQLPRPPDNGQASPQGPVMRRRNASRRKPTFHKVLRGQGPTIK